MLISFHERPQGEIPAPAQAAHCGKRYRGIRLCR
jgi:hypothetical protein